MALFKVIDLALLIPAAIISALLNVRSEKIFFYLRFSS
jgi:hypothetical protein